jgi:hypothetical protein
MTMKKKLSLLLAMSAIVAFAAPAFASAATGLTENGVLIPVGSKLEYTSLGIFLITSEKLGNIECKAATFTTIVVRNGAAEADESGVAGRSTASTCSRAGTEVKVFGIEVPEIKTTGGGTGVISQAFKVELTPGGTVCTFVGTNDTFTYKPTETSEGGAVITVEKGALSVTPAACGKSASIDELFTRETDETNIHVFLM